MGEGKKAQEGGVWGQWEAEWLMGAQVRPGKSTKHDPGWAQEGVRHGPDQNIPMMQQASLCAHKCVLCSQGDRSSVPTMTKYGATKGFGMEDDTWKHMRAQVCVPRPSRRVEPT